MDQRFLIAHQQQKKRRPRKASTKRAWPKLSHTSDLDSTSATVQVTSPMPANRPALKTSPSQAIGYAYKKKAITYLQTQGLTLLACNLSCPLGEIDAVMRDGSILVFVEIRHRHQQHYGGATESITKPKLMRLQRTAQYFLPQLSATFFQDKTPICRFDAIVTKDNGSQLVWLKHISS